jgi:hypothetical protein
MNGIVSDYAGLSNPAMAAGSASVHLAQASLILRRRCLSPLPRRARRQLETVATALASLASSVEIMERTTAGGAQ